MWSLHEVECYSAVTRKALWTPAMAWVDLQGTLLSEVSPSQKDQHCKMPLTQGPQESQIHRDRNGWGDGGAGDRRSSGEGR